jgi:hypothetical protein
MVFDGTSTWWTGVGFHLSITPNSDFIFGSFKRSISDKYMENIFRCAFSFFHINHSTWHLKFSYFRASILVELLPKPLVVAKSCRSTIIRRIYFPCMHVAVVTSKLFTYDINFNYTSIFRCWYDNWNLNNIFLFM